MTGKNRISGALIVAVVALGAFGAPGAQAGGLDFGTQPAVLFGHSEAGQNHVVTLTATNQSKFNFACSTGSYEGTMQGLSVNEKTVTSTFSGCTAFGVQSQILFNGCKYTITGAGHAANTATIDIVGCTSGKQIEIKTAVCTMDIPEQNGISHVVATNLGGNEVTLSATMSGLSLRQTGAACPDGNGHQSTSGSATGNTIMKARVDVGGHVVTKHSHQYQELTQTGAQVSLTST